MNKRTWSSSLRVPSLQLSPNQRQDTQPLPFSPSLLSGLDWDQRASHTARSLCGNPTRPIYLPYLPLSPFCPWAYTITASSSPQVC